MGKECLVNLLSYLGVVLAFQADISLSDASAVAVFVALAFSGAVVSNVTEVALAHVRRNAISVWFTPLLAVWLALQTVRMKCKNKSSRRVT